MIPETPNPCEANAVLPAARDADYLVLPPYQVFSRKPLDRLKSFEGQKIYTTGGAKDLTMHRIDAVPVHMGTSEVFESMTRGTIDGALIAYSTALAYNLQGLAKHGTVGENFGSGVITYVISETKWKQLPPNVQKVMSEAGDAITRKACARIDESVDADMAKLRQGGVALTRLPEADHKSLQQVAGGLARDWAADLDKRGKRGTQVLEAFQRALTAK